MGYRVYREATGPSAKKDDHGTYEGWSEKQDDLMPMICPRLAPWQTRVKKTVQADDVEEDLDEHIKPEEGHDRVFAVPRIWNCTSKVYIHMMNLFGHLGGFAMILDLL